jgi:hypothetical protein
MNVLHDFQTKFEIDRQFKGLDRILPIFVGL